jgi:hypothetical protein
MKNISFILCIFLPCHTRRDNPMLSPVRLYLPWGANLPDYNNDGDIIVSYPPEGLMPGVDIDKLLDEHLSLALELAEKSRYEIIKRGASANLSDESIKGSGLRSWAALPQERLKGIR